MTLQVLYYGRAPVRHSGECVDTFWRLETRRTSTEVLPIYIGRTETDGVHIEGRH